DQLVAVVEPDAEHPAREGLEHLALHLDLFLAADCPRPLSLALSQWRRPPARSRARGRAQRLDRDDVRRLRSFRALAGLVFDLCVLGEGLEPVARDVA